MKKDAAHYLHHLDEIDLPPGLKIEILEAMLNILQVIVDWCWSEDEAENPLGIASDLDSPAGSHAIESKGLKQTFNRAAAGLAGA